MKRPLKICLISLNSYPLFAQNHTGYFGGAELQMSLLAKALNRDKRFRVSVIVGDYNQPNLVSWKGIKLYKCFRKRWPGVLEAVRFFWILKKIDADVYLERILNLKVGLVSLFCRIWRKKFVYMVAHDWDTKIGHANYLTGLKSLSFDFGLKRADLIISQTRRQQKRLKNNFNLPSVVIHSLTATVPRQQTTSHRFFLWVGRADRWKRPAIFIKLAQRLPKEKLVMICRPGQDKDYFAKIKSLALGVKNLRFLEVATAEGIWEFFKQAKALINTSIAEGFPNTFLQAGQVKTPIISLVVNPDGFIDRFGCGRCAKGNFAGLIRACREVSAKMGDNNYRYVTKYHSRKNSRLFAQILLDHFGRPAL